MKDVRVLGKIKRYMAIYQIILVLLACMLTFIMTEGNIFVTLIFGVLTGIISMIVSIVYNSSVNKALIDDKEIKKVRDDISDELEYNSPMPNIVVDVNGKIIWYNNISMQLFNKKDLLNKKIEELINGFELDLIINGEEKGTIESYQIDSNFYDIKYEMIRKQNRMTLENNVYYILYFFDITERVEAYEKFEHEKTLFGYVYIDNYEEIVNSTEEIKRPMMLGVIERKLQTFAKELDGTIKKIEKDRFLLVLTKENLDKVIESKFKILEEIRKINVGNELPVTLSIGVSLVGESIEHLMDNSKDAAEIAISRGGNQAVIKKDENDYEYYGAKSKQEVEGNNASKAKARIKAYALKEMLTVVDNVLIMGHTNPDLDAIGSSMGMARVCKELGKDTHIILNEPNSAIYELHKRVLNSEDYESDYFINSEEALKYDKDTTALIICDVNSPTYTECPEIIDIMDKIAIIDHHIRGTQFVEHAKIVYLDPFASSASEAVVQIAQYMIEKIKFTELEVDAMLAGILLDTKNFMFKTGVKTFEAAAYLKKCGADNLRVKCFFQNDLDSFKKKAEAIRKAEVYKDSIIITICPSKVKTASTLVAQIADELLNISGIEASFVVYDTGNDECIVSARSNGNINVQLIMEDLGGGGHFVAAGVQLKNVKTKEVIDEIKKCVDTYFEETGINTSKF